MSVFRVWSTLAVFIGAIMFSSPTQEANGQLKAINKVRVVNVIPKSQSGETNQDSEPNLTVNPANLQQMVGSAFTPDPFGGPNAPVFVTLDGGATWTMNSIIPSETMTGDITVRFGGNGRLYAAILRRPSDQLRMNILRTSDVSSADLMEVLVDRNQVDQPYIDAFVANGKDYVYVGGNDLGAVGGKTATIDRSTDAGTVNAANTFGKFRIETRDTSGQNGPQIRTAASKDGKTVYAIYYGWRKFDDLASLATIDVVVVRDDNSGIGPNPFRALKDPTDELAGIRIVTGRKLPWNTPRLGQDRVGGDPAIAVDPNDKNIVYVTWSDQVEGVFTLHVRRSTDGGKNWSNDLRTLPNAKNPGLAINKSGQVGLVYQQVRGSTTDLRWATTFELTSDGFATLETAELANTPANSPLPDFLPYLGDYLHLLTMGNDFYGIFAASNLPDQANFPCGVTFQRNVDFTTKRLLDVDGTSFVPTSIDPYFFSIVVRAAKTP